MQMKSFIQLKISPLRRNSFPDTTELKDWRKHDTEPICPEENKVKKQLLHSPFMSPFCLKVLYITVLLCSHPFFLCVGFVFCFVFFFLQKEVEM